MWFVLRWLISSDHSSKNLMTSSVDRFIFRSDQVSEILAYWRRPAVRQHHCHAGWRNWTRRLRHSSVLCCHGKQSRLILKVFGYLTSRLSRSIYGVAAVNQNVTRLFFLVDREGEAPSSESYSIPVYRLAGSWRATICNRPAAFCEAGEKHVGRLCRSNHMSLQVTIELNSFWTR